jgi:hypothetical protein
VPVRVVVTSTAVWLTLADTLYPRKIPSKSGLGLELKKRFEPCTGSISKSQVEAVAGVVSSETVASRTTPENSKAEISRDAIPLRFFLACLAKFPPVTSQNVAIRGTPA